MSRRRFPILSMCRCAHYGVATDHVFQLPFKVCSMGYRFGTRLKTASNSLPHLSVLILELIQNGKSVIDPSISHNPNSDAYLPESSTQSNLISLGRSTLHLIPMIMLKPCPHPSLRIIICRDGTRTSHAKYPTMMRIIASPPWALRRCHRGRRFVRNIFRILIRS